MLVRLLILVAITSPAEFTVMFTTTRPSSCVVLVGTGSPLPEMLRPLRSNVPCTPTDLLASASKLLNLFHGEVVL